MTDPLEVELKLEVAPADWRKLEAIVPAASSDGAAEHLVSTYFDTPKHALRDAGLSLRVRRQGRVRIQTVKAAGGSAAGLFERREWEHRIKGDRPVLDTASDPLLQILGREVLDRIDPIFTTDIHRAHRTVRSADAAIDIALDTGAIRAGDRHESIHEIEIELGTGTPQALFDLARCLDKQVPLRLGVQSKAERGYRLIAGRPAGAVKAEPIVLDAMGDAGEAFQAIARACLQQFRLNETVLLATGEVEPLHQARVALRRLRSAFSLYRDLLKGDARAELLRGELRWLAVELGKVRNLDVLGARIDDRETRERVAAARTETFRHVRAELASARTRLLMIDLVEWLALGDWRTQPADPALLHRDVIGFAHDLLADRRQRLRQNGRGFARLDAAHRHRVRIAAKKLRYAVEFFWSLYAHGKARRRRKAFLAGLEELQDQLGALNDLATGPALLARLGIDAELPQADPQTQDCLVRQAAHAFAGFADAKRFW